MLIPLHHSDLLLAAALLLVNAGLSLWLDLGIARRLAVSAVRMVVQLLLVGLVLKLLFSQSSLGLTALAGLVMVGFSGWEIHSRQDRRFVGWWSVGLGSSAMLSAGGIATFYTLTVVLQPQPWHDPRLALPLLGMVLGNAMTGVSLGLNRLTSDAVTLRPAIEARLALGQTRTVAFAPLLRRSLRTALLPTVNAMAATGVVSLPGMMTGQILAGADPMDAVKYQIMIMLVIAGGTGIGALVALRIGAWRLSDNRHRLRLDRLRP